jgi:hypothetical protein
LALVKIVYLTTTELAEVRKEALKLDQRAYQFSDVTWTLHPRSKRSELRVELPAAPTGRPDQAVIKAATIETGPKEIEK